MLKNNKYDYLLDDINGYPLDKHQRKVVFCDKQNTIVIAGAGSGKSTTIVGKIKYLLTAKGLKPDEILAISFTNESVNSLSSTLLKNDCQGVEVLTFHKLALKMIKGDYKIIESDYLDYVITEVTRSNACYQRTIKTIISLYYSQALDPSIFLKLPKKYLKITIDVLKCLIEYENEKKALGAIDFDDMISIATLEESNLNYKFIIIDEYQDSSLLRINLIKSIIKKTNAHLLVVGDDWQSIYRFSGCDVNIFLNFRKYFKKVKTLKIVNTYRNSNELIRVASKFITKNPYQIRKKLIAKKSANKPIYIIYYNDNYKKALKKAIDNINPKKKILILGRNNFDINKYLDHELVLDNNKIIYKNDIDRKITYMTIHKSKGLESDEVIILNLTNELYGLPSLKRDEKVLKYFQTSKSVYKFDEERRLFYVAITRTKNHVFLLVNKKNPSIFVKEILKDSRKYIKII